MEILLEKEKESLIRELLKIWAPDEVIEVIWEYIERKLFLPTEVGSPEGITAITWLASQNQALVELAGELYKQMRQFCTEKSCPKMRAGKFEYQWKHHPRSPKPRSYPAPYYMRLTIQWMNEQRLICDMEQMRQYRLIVELSKFEAKTHSLFGVRVVKELISDYLYDPFYYISGIWAKLISIFAHLFASHFGDGSLGREGSEQRIFIETLFERVIRFVKAYRILSTRRLSPLEDRIRLLKNVHSFGNIPGLENRDRDRDRDRDRE